MLGQCRLCLQYAELQRSHIIPSFVIDWLKESSPGYIRSNHSPNLRIQDGCKLYLLCWDCEQLLNRWETIFCQRIFSPLHRGDQVAESISYGPWALKFAVSVSWRVLLYRTELGVSDLSAEQQVALTQAKNVWRRFLLGELRHPRQFEQHLLPMDVVNDNRLFQQSPFINRYLVSTVDMDVISWPQVALVYTKLGRLLLFGHIKNENRSIWKGTKLHVTRGVIGPKAYELPSPVLDHIGERANQTAAAASRLSAKQQKKVEEMVNDNLERVKTSEFIRGLRSDIAASGEIILSQADTDDTY